jgi:hypothetical protein
MDTYSLKVLGGSGCISASLILLDGMAHVTIYSYGYPATSCMYKAGTAPTCDIEEDKSIYTILHHYHCALRAPITDTPFNRL